MVACGPLPVIQYHKTAVLIHPCFREPLLRARLAIARMNQTPWIRERLLRALEKVLSGPRGSLG